jgi:hypothetical protein
VLSPVIAFYSLHRMQYNYVRQSLSNTTQEKLMQSSIQQHLSCATACSSEKSWKNNIIINWPILYMDLINGKESPKKINSRNCLISITLTSYRNSILIQLSSRKKTNLLEYLQNIDYRIEFLPRLHGLSIVKQSTIQIDWEE